MAAARGLGFMADRFYTWRCHDALPGDEMRLSVRTRLLTSSCVGAALSLITLTAQQSQAPVFTSRTWLVPIDVRVVDSGGRPIPGLTAADFTITEDNVPQQIRGVEMGEAPISGS